MNRPTVARTTVGWASGVTRGWVWLYTARLPADLKEQRRAEIASDLWEQSDAAAAEREARAALTALVILERCLLGVPADLVWCVEAAIEARRSQPGASRRKFSVSSTLAQRAFTGLALLSVSLMAVLAMDVVARDDAPNWGALLLLGASLLIAVGLWQQRRRPLLGQIAVVVPIVGIGVITWWSFVGPALAGLVLVTWTMWRG